MWHPSFFIFFKYFFPKKSIISPENSFIYPAKSFIFPNLAIKKNLKSDFIKGEWFFRKLYTPDVTERRASPHLF